MILERPWRWTRWRCAGNAAGGTTGSLILMSARFFDSVDHSRMLKAVERHTDTRWVLLYVTRWLKAPMQKPDGTLAARDRGTPQGSAVSPVLANLYLHYAFDMWLAREHPGVAFERYCDDCPGSAAGGGRTGVAPR